MKRIALFILAVLALVGVAACGGDHNGDPVGVWNAGLAYRCDGNYHRLTFRFFEGGGFRDSTTHTGRWAVDGDDIRVRMSNGYVLAGTIAGDRTMSGTFTGGDGPGCWEATKSANLP
ncbi:MAG TPA: hypothetical protein VI078_11830 [bacterium]